MVAGIDAKEACGMDQLCGWVVGRDQRGGPYYADVMVVALPGRGLGFSPH